MAWEISPDLGLRIWTDFDNEQIARIFEAHQKRVDEEWFRTAWLASNILNAWGAKTTPEKLLGGAFRKPPPSAPDEPRDED